MADTYSSLLGLLLMETGLDQDTWGDLHNANVTEILERAIAGNTSRAVLGGTLDLSASPPPAGPSQVLDAVLTFTGVLAADQTIVVPNLKKTWLVVNSTTGAFGLIIKTTSGSASCSVPRSARHWVICDGANGVTRIRAPDAGEIFDFGGTTAPTGSFECDGALKSRASYPELFAAIGTTWGAGDGVTTFGLPDFYTSGRYTRSRTASVTIGTYQADSLASHTHTATATTTLTMAGTATSNGAHTHTDNGSTVTASNGAHTHSVTTATDVGGTQAPSRASAGTVGANSFATSSDGAHTHTVTFTTSSNGAHTHTVDFTGSSAATSVTVNSTGSTETRPLTAVVMKCIRY